jgi:DegV family protein with EDD domain
MASVAIVTDSTADIPEELCSKYEITVVPLSVIFEERAFVDNGIELTKKQFYSKLKESRKLPTTTQPTPADFKKVYCSLLKNHDCVISIHISKKMSGTSDSAEIAKKELCDDRIEIIDSELTTIALGLIVLEAARRAGGGASKEEITSLINDIRNRINTLFIPITLEYLQKGGRIGRAKGLIASLLEIKPILTLSFGEVSQFKTTRRWNQAKKELLNSMQDKIKNSSRLIVAIGDADLKEDGDELAKIVSEKYNPGFLMRSEIGCIVGTHLGPGIAIAFYEE